MAETMDLQSRLSANNPMERTFLADQRAMLRKLKRTQVLLRAAEADPNTPESERLRLQGEARGLDICLSRGQEFRRKAIDE